MIQPIIFDRAGSVMLTKYDACGRIGTDADDKYYRHGDLFSVQPTSSDTTHTVESGNSLYPVMEKVTAKNDTLALVFNTEDPEMEAFIFGQSITKNQSMTMTEINQQAVIPETSPYTVKLEHSVATPSETLVVDVANNGYTFTSGVATAKQFSVSADTLTFASGEAGKSVYITYDWTAEGFMQDVEANENSAVMQLEHTTDAVTEFNGQLYRVNMVYDKVKVTEYGKPLIGKTPGTRQMTARILAPRGGKPAVRRKYVPMGETCE